MANQPDAYAQVVGDSQQTVSLAGAVVDLFKGPVTSLWQRRSTLQSLRADLGEWAVEAVDEAGNFLQPVLRAPAFERHLIAHNAHLSPNGTCTSILGWAQLLYALDIRPGNNIVSWRRPPRAKDPATTGQVDLEIDGQVLCHVINLYRLYDGKFAKSYGGPGESTDVEAARLLEHGCKMPFGRLSLIKNGPTYVATFRCTTTEELSESRKPFCCTRAFGWWEGLVFEPSVVVVRYLNALYHEVSEPEAVLADPKAPLQERAQVLIKAHRRLDRPGRKSVRTEPFLITNAWFTGANRVIRRITSNGGTDTTLVDDIVASFEKLPNVVAYLTEEGEFPFGKNDPEKPPIEWHKRLRESIAGAMEFFNRPFVFEWGSGGSERVYVWEGIVAENIHQALEPLAKMPRGTWKHTLSQMPIEVAQIFRLDKWWEGRPAVILEFTPSSEMWKADCLMKG